MNPNRISSKPRTDVEPVEHKSQTVHSNFENFNWNQANPWLSTNPEFEYILTKYRQNEAFYWLWRCPNRSAPVIVHFSGGPGRSSLVKAFGGYNPLSIDSQKKCFYKNRNSVSHHYNLLYIEAPIGAGFSRTTSKTYDRTFVDLHNTIGEIFSYQLKKYPDWRSSLFFFNGEGFCGLSIPAAVWHLYATFGLRVRGVILENPIMHPDQHRDSKFKLNALTKKKDFWKSSCHKGICSCCVRTGGCCYRAGIIERTCAEEWSFWPWNWRGISTTEKDKATGQNVHLLKCNPYNISEENCYKENCNQNQLEIESLQKSRKFHEHVKARKIYGSDSGSKFMNILEKDHRFNSVNLCGFQAQENVYMTILTGDGDYLCPYEAVEYSVGMWDCKEISGQMNAVWKEKADKVRVKEWKNLKWVRKEDVGGLMWADDREWWAKIIVELVDQQVNEI